MGQFLLHNPAQLFLMPRPLDILKEELESIETLNPPKPIGMAWVVVRSEMPRGIYVPTKSKVLLVHGSYIGFAHLLRRGIAGFRGMFVQV